jgi:endosialidase-like protein
MRIAVARLSVVVVLLLGPTSVHAQQSSRTAATSVPRVMHVSGVFAPANGQPAGAVESVTIAIYAEETGGTPLWEETQQVTIDSNGRYSILLGATRPGGLPEDLFASGQARWLGRRFERAGEVEQSRVLLASVPYSLKASDADTLGGRPASDYVVAGSGARGAATTSTTQEGVAGPLDILPGVVNNVPKYYSTTDIGTSSIFDIGGLVGVGTPSPADAMHLRFTNTTGTMTGLAVQNLGGNATSYSGMLFYDQNGALGQFQGFNNSTHEYRINNIASSGSINFMLGSNSKFLVAANGNVGIGGISNPASPLVVNGDVGSTGGDFRPLGTQFDGMMWVNAAGTIQAHMHRFGAVDNNLYITNAGAANLTGVFLAPGATSLTSTSDERLKTDIEPVTGILDKIQKIRVVSFNMASRSVDKKTGKAAVEWNVAARTMMDGKPIKQQIGSIAQDWVQDFPELVVEPKSGDEFYGLAYDRIGVIALGAVKELNEVVAQKDREIKALTDRLDALEQLLRGQAEKQPQQK